MERQAALQAEFRSASWRLLRKAAFYSGIVPLVVLALFSATVFRFGAKQYLVYLLAVVATVIPIVSLSAAVYFSMQRRLLRRILAWYDRPRDPLSAEDRSLGVKLQKSLYSSGFRHGIIVFADIFLSLTLSVVIFGRFADFTPYLSFSYIALGFLLAMVEFFITVFISHREMRPVMRFFLSDFTGFDYYTAAGFGKRLASFAMVIMLLTIGIAWIGSSYISSDTLREEIERRGRDNVMLLASRLERMVEDGSPREDWKDAVEGLSLYHDEMVVLADGRGDILFHLGRGLLEGLDPRLVAEIPAGEGQAESGFRVIDNREYLFTSASLEGTAGWRVARLDRTEVSFYAMWRQTPTMLLLLLVTAGVAALLTLILSHNISDPLKRLVRCCRSVATGNLEVEVPVDSLDDVGELSSSYADMLRSLREITSGLVDTSREVNSGAESIVSVSEEITASIEELNALVQDLSGQIEEEVEHIGNVEEIMAGVSETISLSHAQASQSLEMSQDAERLVQEGRENAREAVRKIADFKEMLDASMDAILSLGESSRKIDNIVEMITRIADQTNLLALNAAIEAARVPEYGKGFAVVADEVKKLAQEAAASAQRIGDLVKAIQKDVETAKGLMEKGTMGMYVGMETVDRTDQSLASISEIVGKMARMAEAIARASSQELEQSERLASSLEAMRSQVESTAQAYEEIGASSDQQTQVTVELTGTAEKLSDIAHRLMDMVSRFKTSGDGTG